MKAPNVWTYIEHALSTPAVAAIAQEKWADVAPSLFHPHAVEVSASSAGRCVLELWAHLHGHFDLPETYETMLAKMDGGTMYGARIATLFAAGYEDLHADAHVDTETIIEHDGIPGHTDIIVNDGDSHVIEVKTSFWGQDFRGPSQSHIVQACKYALGKGSEGFSVFTLLPGAQKSKGVARPHYSQTDYLVEEWGMTTAQEYARLKKAEADEAPEQDVNESWRCASCRFSGCPKNVNPAREMLAPL